MTVPTLTLVVALGLLAFGALHGTSSAAQTWTLVGAVVVVAVVGCVSALRRGGATSALLNAAAAVVGIPVMIGVAYLTSGT